jgi:hypothetical protein
MSNWKSNLAGLLAAIFFVEILINLQNLQLKDHWLKISTFAMANDGFTTIYHLY